MPVLLETSPAFARHIAGIGHPEVPEALDLGEDPRSCRAPPGDYADLTRRAAARRRGRR